MARHIAPDRVVEDSIHVPGVYSATAREQAEREFGWDDPSTLDATDAEAMAQEITVLARHRELLTEGKPITVSRLFVGGTGCRMPASAFPGSRLFVVEPSDTVRPCPEDSDSRP